MSEVRPIIIFDSRNSGSIISAAIAMIKDRTSIPVDIANANIKTLIKESVPEYYENVFVMVDGVKELLHDSTNPKAKVFHIESSERVTNDILINNPGLKMNEGEVFKNRVLLTWEALNPGKGRPLAVHLLGKYQVIGADVFKAKYLHYAVLTYLNGFWNEQKKFDERHERWKHLVSLEEQEVHLLDSLCRMGKAIHDYIQIQEKNGSSKITEPVKKVIQEKPIIEKKTESRKAPGMRISSDTKKKPRKKVVKKSK